MRDDTFLYYVRVTTASVQVMLQAYRLYTNLSLDGFIDV